MTITKTFTVADQLDPQGNVVDKIFTINEIETLQFQKIKTLSGAEVAAKIQDLKDKKTQLQNKIDEINEEINFYKLLV